jgi:hypothetical protein
MSSKPKAPSLASISPEISAPSSLSLPNKTNAMDTVLDEHMML